MNLFIDCEFTSLPGDNSSSDLLSIGLYCEDGSSYYACRSDVDLDKLSAFSKENVVPLLPNLNERKPKQVMSLELAAFLANKEISAVWATFPTKKQLLSLFGSDANVDEIYRKYADWDFQLLLRYLPTVPQHLPTHCENITPLYQSLSPEDIPKNDRAHDALSDAIWNYKVWKTYHGNNVAVKTSA